MEPPSTPFSPSSDLGSPSSGGRWDRGDREGGGGEGANEPFDSTNFNVVIRVRPPLPREQEFFQPAVKVLDERTITISENLAALEDASVSGAYATHTFNFDYVYDQDSDQRSVYDTTAKAVVDSSLAGYNATIFAYGQTGTGKTYTMEGFNSAEERGIIPRSIEQVFRHIQELCVSPRKRAFLVRASYLQIYNEVISDLLKPARTNLHIREEKKRGIYVEGLSEWVVRSPAEIYGLMERGGSMRATGSTRMNELSSRSHAVFIIIAEQSETTYLDDNGAEMSVEEFHRLLKSRAHGEAALKALEANVRQSFKVGKLNLVDLAGSERVRLTGATGQRLEETKKINQSLSALGNVIAALTDPRGRQHIPYRDSKLTRILEDSLGGNCKTTMMAMISPALEAFVESLSTLKFANRAKNVKNEARINEDLDQKSLLRRYERELKKLRQELSERAKSVVDNRKLLELDEQRRRAEEDKLAAIRTLEIRSQEFMREKQEKKRLEERITMLQAKIVLGGASGLGGAAAAAAAVAAAAAGGVGGAAALAEIPAFRNALKEHQERIRTEYEGRLRELEGERESMEEEKAQVDRYKQLLLKQRDIMILLTQRLNERDEQIMALQDELDAYDRHQKEVEEKLDEKTAALIHLQRVALEQDAVSPVRNTRLAEALGAWASPGGGGGGGRGGPRGGSAAANAAAPSLLITTRQYRAYGEGGGSAGGVWSPGGGASGSGSSSSSSGELLSAGEKIGELTRLVDVSVGERERLAREYEDLKAEKAQMESMLKDRLEKLVGAEIERRMSEGGGQAPPTSNSTSSPSTAAAVAAATAAATAAASGEIARLREEVERVSGAKAGELEEAQRRASHLRKEKEAISSIMENKISALVDSVTAGITASVPLPPGGQPPKWMRELGALDRLVKASIAALKAQGPV